MSKYNYHCDICRCPIEHWEPLKAYPSDNSCKLYSDFFDVIWELEEKERYNLKDVLKECEKFKKDYPDISDFDVAVREMIDIGIDTGIITGKYIWYIK